MGEMYSASYAFNSSAGNAVTIIADLCQLPKAPDPPQIDVRRIECLQRLAEELEKGLSGVKGMLEDGSSLAPLKDLRDGLSILGEKYAVCLRQWRKEGGRNLTPPILWRRLEEADKNLKRLYQDVCDHIVFAAAEDEEAVSVPPGELEALVLAAHQEERPEDSHDS